MRHEVRRDRPRRAHGHRARPRRAVDRDATEPYDQLVIATGATPVRPPLPGVDARGVLRRADPRRRHRAARPRVDDRQPKRAVVVGRRLHRARDGRGAAAARASTSRSSTAARQPMPTLDPDMGALVADAIRGLGIDLHTGTDVEAFETDADGHVRAVVTARPDVPGRPRRARHRREARTSTLAAAAGIDDRPTGGIVTDAAHGDERRRRVGRGRLRRDASTASRGRPVAIALGTHANKQGRVVGHQRDRRRRDVPRRDRHRGHEDLRVRGRRAPGSPSAKRSRRGLRRRRRDASRRRRRRGVLPGRGADHGEGRRRAGHRAAARRADHRQGRRGQAHRRARDRDLERDDRRGHRRSSTSATPRRSRRCGTRCSSRPATRRGRACPPGSVNGGRARACALLGLEVGLVHHLHELLEADRRLPAELLAWPSTRRRSAGRPRPAGRSAGPA